MANNYKDLQSQFRGLVEKRTAEIAKAGKEKFSRTTGVKRKSRKGQSLIASRVSYNASRDNYKEQHSLILNAMLKELGATKGKVSKSMLVEAAQRVGTNAKQQQEVATL